MLSKERHQTATRPNLASRNIRNTLSEADRAAFDQIILNYDRDNFDPGAAYARRSEKFINIPFGYFVLGDVFRSAIAAHYSSGSPAWMLDDYFEYLFEITGENIERLQQNQPLIRETYYASYFDLSDEAIDLPLYRRTHQELIYFETFYVIAHEYGHILRPREPTIFLEESKADRFAFDLMNRRGYPVGLGLTPIYSLAFFRPDSSWKLDEDRHPGSACRVAAAIHAGLDFGSIFAAMPDRHKQRFSEMQNICPNY